MSEPTTPIINLEFLPDWARPSTRPTPAPRFETREERPRRSEGRRDGPPRDRRPSGPRQGGRDGARRPSRPAFARPAPPPEPPRHLRAEILPEPRAMASVVEQIQTTGRAYPLFSLAKMFLEKPERYHVRFLSLDAPLAQCATCEAVMLDDGAMVSHALAKHRDLYYKEERVAVDPPKGTFTSVARCGLNGAILGPTNHHAYQANLMQLYREKFRHLPFEKFKGSIKSVHDPAAVKAWQEQSSSKSAWQPLQGEGTAPLQSLSEMELHFREKHLPAMSRRQKEFTLEGAVAHRGADGPLRAALQAALDEENRFPNRLAGKLHSQFQKEGLPVFKGPRRMLFVGVAWPKPLVADATNVSKSICAILDFIKVGKECGRKELLRVLAPAAEGAAPPDTTALILQDLHWLIRQGHVIEFHTGTLELARTPEPRKAPAPKPAPAPTATTE